MSHHGGSRIFPVALYGAIVLLALVVGSAPAWSQTDITSASLPHYADSVFFGFYDYIPENVSNELLGLYGAAWHSGDERTGQPFPHWVLIDFGTPRVVTQLNVLAYSEAFDSGLRLNEFRFEGSGDGVIYTPLHPGLLQYANRHEWQSFFFANSTGYRYYRLYGLNNWGCTDYCEQMIIEEWEMFEGTPNGLEVAMTPQNPPVAIPAVGGEFSYDVTIQNATASAIVADLGIQVVLPDGSLRTVRFMSDITFPAGSTIVRNGLSQTVPAEAPLGIYTYRLSVGHVGVEVLDSAEFTFEKLGATIALHDEADWALKGWGDLVPVDDTAPAPFLLSDAVPNPFNPATTLGFDLPATMAVSLRIYDVSGRLIRTLLDGEIVAQGRREVAWNGRDDFGKQVAAGVYFYRLEAGAFNQTRRMTLVR